MLKVMEWQVRVEKDLLRTEVEVWVEKDLLRREVKVWVESMGVSPDERLNWYFKDGKLEFQMRKIQEVLPEGFIPMFSGPMNIMKQVMEKMAAEYPSSGFVRSDDHDKMIRDYKDFIAGKDEEIKKWEQRFDKTLNAALDNRQPIMATLESTEDELPVLQPNALVDTFTPDGVQVGFFVAVFFVVFVLVGRAFRWW